MFILLRWKLVIDSRETKYVLSGTMLELITGFKLRMGLSNIIIVIAFYDEEV